MTASVALEIRLFDLSVDAHQQGQADAVAPDKPAEDRAVRGLIEGKAPGTGNDTVMIAVALWTTDNGIISHD